MNKSFVSLAVIFFGICIVVSSLYISDALKQIAHNQQADTTTITEDTSEWEMIVVNENNIILFNRHTGHYWRKFIESDQGPIDWEKGTPPSD